MRWLGLVLALKLSAACSGTPAAAPATGGSLAEELAKFAFGKLRGKWLGVTQDQLAQLGAQ